MLGKAVLIESIWSIKCGQLHIIGKPTSYYCPSFHFIYLKTLARKHNLHVARASSQPIHFKFQTTSRASLKQKLKSKYFIERRV